MNHSTLCALLLATPALASLGEQRLPPRKQRAGVREDSRSRPVTPQSTYDLEQALREQSRAWAGVLLAEQLNPLEPPDAPPTAR